MNIIGIAGRSGAGKSTVANILEWKCGFVVVNLADPIKRAAREFFDFTAEQCWGDLKDAPDKRYPRSYGDVCTQCGEIHVKEYLTPRRAFQQIGTEIGRTLYKDVWVRYLLERANDILVGQAIYTYEKGIDWGVSRFVQGVAVGDVRFANEAKAIVAAGGQIWLCQRDVRGLTQEAATHLSERLDIPDELISGRIDNNGSLESLPSRVHELYLSAYTKRA